MMHLDKVAEKFKSGNKAVVKKKFSSVVQEFYSKQIPGADNGGMIPHNPRSAKLRPLIPVNGGRR